MQDKFHNIKLAGIYNRIGNIVNARKNKKNEYLKIAIATALEVDPQDISNWAFRERFPWPELFKFSQKHNIPFDWLLTGEEKENSFMCGWDPDTKELCKKVREVVESKTHWGDLLRVNIKSFHAGLKGHEEMKNAINELKKSTADLSLEDPLNTPKKKDTSTT